MPNDQNLISLTVDIVSSHVANNNVSTADVPIIVQRVYEALADLGKAAAEEPAEAKVPVVSMRASIKPDYIVCMECGKRQKTLKRHLQTAHRMTPTEYRKDYGLPDTYPMTSPNYSESRRVMARSIGLGRKPAGADRKASDNAAPGPKKRARGRPRKVPAP